MGVMTKAKLQLIHDTHLKPKYVCYLSFNLREACPSVHLRENKQLWKKLMTCKVNNASPFKTLLKFRYPQRELHFIIICVILVSVPKERKENLGNREEVGVKDKQKLKST
jgi:hypothetical protein